MNSSKRVYKVMGGKGNKREQRGATDVVEALHPAAAAMSLFDGGVTAFLFVQIESDQPPAFSGAH
jgi:hypothetical protein